MLGHGSLSASHTMSTKYLSKAQDLIKEHQFLVLSKSWCPDCHYVHDLFAQLGVTSKVHVIELDKLDDQDEAGKLEAAFTEVSGRKWVPTIFLNGKRFGTEQDLKELKASGDLETVLKQEKLIE